MSPELASVILAIHADELWWKDGKEKAPSQLTPDEHELLAALSMAIGALRFYGEQVKKKG